jgi:hypothetical protein
MPETTRMSAADPRPQACFPPRRRVRLLSLVFWRDLAGEPFAIPFRGLRAIAAKPAVTLMRG